MASTRHHHQETAAQHGQAQVVFQKCVLVFRPAKAEPLLAVACVCVRESRRGHGGGVVERTELRMGLTAAQAEETQD